MIENRSLSFQLCFTKRLMQFRLVGIIYRNRKPNDLIIFVLIFCVSKASSSPFVLPIIGIASSKAGVKPISVSIVSAASSSFILSSSFFTNWSLTQPFSPVVLLSTFNHVRSEEHTSELQSRFDLVCRLLLEKK